jgi:type II secretory pathway component PulM
MKREKWTLTDAVFFTILAIIFILFWASILFGFQKVL